MKPVISAVGIGRMGAALARAFLQQGYETVVWNRTASKLEPLAAAGARIAASVRDAVTAADIIIVNVIDYAASDRLLRADEVTRALRGKLLVQLTSGSPRQARDLAAWAQQHGIRYLDGAIMATPNQVGSPACTVLYAGPADLFAAHQPVLAALGEHAVHVGPDIGHASALDSALLVVMWGALFGAIYGVAVCDAEGLRIDAYEQYLEPILPQLNGWMLNSVSRVGEGRLAGDETTLATLDAHYGAFRCLLELCEERGLNRVVPNAFDQLFKAALDALAKHEDDGVRSFAGALRALLSANGDRFVFSNAEKHNREAVVRQAIDRALDEPGVPKLKRD